MKRSGARILRQQTPPTGAEHTPLDSEGAGQRSGNAQLAIDEGVRRGVAMLLAMASSYVGEQARHKQRLRQAAVLQGYCCVDARQMVQPARRHAVRSQPRGGTRQLPRRRMRWRLCLCQRRLQKLAGGLDLRCAGRREGPGVIDLCQEASVQQRLHLQHRLRLGPSVSGCSHVVLQHACMQRDDTVLSG